MVNQCLFSCAYSIKRLGQVLNSAHHNSSILSDCGVRLYTGNNVSVPFLILDQTMNGMLDILKVLSGLMWTASEALPLGSRER